MADVTCLGKGTQVHTAYCGTCINKKTVLTIETGFQFEENSPRKERSKKYVTGIFMMIFKEYSKVNLRFKLLILRVTTMKCLYNY